jgi:hypothetical protein
MMKQRENMIKEERIDNNSSDGGGASDGGGSDVLAVPPRLGSTQPSFSMFYNFSGSLKQPQQHMTSTRGPREPFSLRKLNANRSGGGGGVLNNNNKNASSTSSSSFAKQNTSYLESFNLKEQSKQLVNVSSSREESVDELHVKRQIDPISLKLNEQYISKISEIKFDLESSLIDQIYATLGLKKKLENCSNYAVDEQKTTTITTNEFSKLEQESSSTNELVDESLSKTLADLYLSKEYFAQQTTSVSYCTVERAPFTCVYEYLNRTNCSTVPVECFHHVLQQFKHCVDQSQDKKQQTQEKNDSTGGQTDETNAHDESTCSRLINVLNQLSVNNQYFKCELIYGECYYWLCKVRRFVDDLYQLKLVKSRELSQSKSPPCVNESAEKLQKSALVESASSVEKHFELSNSNNQNVENKAEDKKSDNSSASLPTSSSSSFSTPPPPPASIGHSPSSTQISPAVVATSIETNDAVVSNNNNNASSDINSGSQSIFFWLKSDLPFIMSHLRLLGWSKRHSRQLKKPHLASLYELNISCRMNDVDCNCLMKLHDDKQPKLLLNDNLMHHTRSSDFGEGTYCELLDESEPQRAYYAFIKRNIAGRLLVEYIDSFDLRINVQTSTIKYTADLENLRRLFSEHSDHLKSTWLFYTPTRLKPIGWLAATEQKLQMVDKKDLPNKIESKVSSDSADHVIVPSSEPTAESKISNASFDSIIEPISIFSSMSKQETNAHDLRQPKAHDSSNSGNSLISYIEPGHCMECLYKHKFYAVRVVEANRAQGYFKLALDYEHSVMLPRTLIYYVEDKPSLHTLFPCKWCSNNNLRVQTPSGWPSERVHERFDWDVYLAQLNQKNQLDSTLILKQIDDLSFFPWLNISNVTTTQTATTAASTATTTVDKFHLGMYLECVNSRSSETVLFEKEHSPQQSVLSMQISLAQIKARLANLLFLKPIDYQILCSLDDVRSNEDADDLLVYTYDSVDIYPVGWCEMNSYYSSTESYFRDYMGINETTCQKDSNENNRNLALKLVQSNAMKISYLAQFKSSL